MRASRLQSPAARQAGRELTLARSPSPGRAIGARQIQRLAAAFGLSNAICTLLLVAIVLRLSGIASGLPRFAAGNLLRILFVAAVGVLLVAYSLVQPSFLAQLVAGVRSAILSRRSAVAFIFVSVLSAAAGVIRGNESLLQDGLLLVWFFVSVAYGASIGAFGTRDRLDYRKAALILAAAGFLQIFSATTYPPLYTIAAPSFTFIAAAPRTGPIIVRLVAVVGIVVLVVEAIQQESLSVIGQIGLCLIVIGYFYARRLDSRVVTPIFALVFIVGLLATPAPPRMSSALKASVGIGPGSGGFGVDCNVCLEERVFEADAVRAVLREDVASPFLGGGLGASVDLRMAPDAATLSSNGRNLAKVDDVHLLFFNVALKTGVVGLLALISWFAGVAVGLERHSRRNSGSQTLVLFLQLLMVAWIAEAMGAANHLFWNPLGGLAFGVAQGLLAKSYLRRPQVIPDVPAYGR